MLLLERRDCRQRFVAPVFFTLALLVHLGTCSKQEVKCASVEYAYKSKGFEDDVPTELISGEHLRICERSMTCCTKEMEHKLASYSRTQFENTLKDEISKTRNKFSSRVQKFDEFFQALLNTSRRDFHEMFLRTYGIQYDANSHIFTDMFSELEKYYHTGLVNLNEAMDNFFHRLYQKMFQIMNSQYTFKDSYLDCVSDYMEELKPFGDVPQKLKLEVKRSFVATRTFVQALGVGRDVIQTIMEVGVSHECSRALMKMSYCPHCNGEPDLKPCSPYCHSVMKGCLAHLSELDREWTNYIDALLNLASRLENSFNIESVVDPIDLKISDAVMNFQENHGPISQRLFKNCGQPRLQKRDAAGGELHFQTLKFTSKNNQVRPTTAAGTSMDRLIQSIRKQMGNARRVWMQLPKKMCEHPKVIGSAQNKSCWNGQDKGWDETNLTNGKNPYEFPVDATKGNMLIAQQNLTLIFITEKLKLAYRGQDVDWEDNSDSSSGSGSGSGDDVDDFSTSSDIYFPVSTPTVPPLKQNKEQKNHESIPTPSAASNFDSKLVVVSVMFFLVMIAMKTGW